MPLIPVEVSIVGCLALTLLTFHFLWVRRYPKPAIFWHAVDYDWLAIALVAVVPQVLEIRRQAAGFDEESAKIDAYFSLDRVRVRLDSYDCAVPGANRSYCAWAEGVRLAFADELPDDPRNFGGIARSSPPAVRDNSAAAAIASVRTAHADYQRDVNRWRNSFWQGQPTELTLLLQVASPFLLVFAVALRVTKVTAQIARERESSRPSTSAQPISRQGSSGKRGQRARDGAPRRAERKR
jgi:hypothetical protein